tara:strand:- start:901 stop:1305 length:405 start_codon:yes stop_codon:yes gene_type:complete
MKENKFLYFRAQATDDDDDSSSDSACYPASSLMGMHPGSDTSLLLFFKPMLRRTPSGNEPDANASFDNHDKISLTIPNNTHLKAMKAIIDSITSNITNENLIVVANNDSGGTEYLANSGITSCASIVINPAYTN